MRTLTMEEVNHVFGADGTSTARTLADGAVCVGSGVALYGSDGIAAIFGAAAAFAGSCLAFAIDVSPASSTTQVLNQKMMTSV